MRQLDIIPDLAALTTQVMTSVVLPLQTGALVTNLTFISGATAAGTPTNWWFALQPVAEPARPVGRRRRRRGRRTRRRRWRWPPPNGSLLPSVYRGDHGEGDDAASVDGVFGEPCRRCRCAGGVEGVGADVGVGVDGDRPGDEYATPTTVATVPYCVAS